MKKIFFGLYIFLCLIKYHQMVAQATSLYAIIDNKLVLVDSTTAQLETYVIIELPQATQLADLTYHSQEGVFYSIKDPSASPMLVSISLEGDYREIGNFTIDGTKIKLTETLAYNQSNNKLYAAVSLNGGAQDNDFWSETIVMVDPLTGACTLVTDIETNVGNPDIDAMTFSDGLLYIFDGAPPGANFSKFFKLDIENAGLISYPQLIYNDNYIPVSDLTIISSGIYFTENRNLYKFNLSNRELVQIGQTHTTSEFNGNIIKGISHIYSCQTALLDLGKDTLLCTGNMLTLDASYPQANYLWQDGSTHASFLVNQPGIYWVKVTTACGSTVDSISVNFHQAPVIELGRDTTLCPGESLVLDVSYPGVTISWQDGLTNSIRTIDSPGIYQVTAKNSCGYVTETIKIEFRGYKDVMMPNVFTPNGDGSNEHFKLDERLVGSKIKIYNRWGKLIYQSGFYQNDWDGEDNPAGTYFYLMEDICSNNYKGWVQILRSSIDN